MKDTRPAAQIAAQLRDPRTTRTDALAIVTLVKGERLAELARLLHVATRGLKAPDVRDHIVDATVGARLSHATVLTYPSERPIPADAANLRPAPTVPAEITSQVHARLAERIRATTAALLAGEATDPAVIAELAAAAEALAAVAARHAAYGAATARMTAEWRTVALDAIRDLARDSGWSSIADVRSRLARLAGAEQDALMIGLLRDGLVDIIPSANLKALSGRERDAALLLGGQQTHAIRVR